LSEKKKTQMPEKEPETIVEEQVESTEVIDPKDQQIETMKKELEELRDQHLRLRAEYDNFRKRTAQEKTAIYQDAVIDTVAEILPIGDNIERAIALKECSAEDMRKGVEMIYQQYQATLKKMDVEEMAGEGEEFNPEIHNAVSHIESEDWGESVISAVFQKGYLKGDKVVRHAMVQVAN